MSICSRINFQYWAKSRNLSTHWYPYRNSSRSEKILYRVERSRKKGVHCSCREGVGERLWSLCSPTKHAVFSKQYDLVRDTRDTKYAWCENVIWVEWNSCPHAAKVVNNSQSQLTRLHSWSSFNLEMVWNVYAHQFSRRRHTLWNIETLENVEVLRITHQLLFRCSAISFISIYRLFSTNERCVTTDHHELHDRPLHKDKVTIGKLFLQITLISSKNDKGASVSIKFIRHGVIKIIFECQT